MILGAAKAALFLCRGRVLFGGRYYTAPLEMQIRFWACLLLACNAWWRRARRNRCFWPFYFFIPIFSISFYNTFLKYVLRVKKIIFFSLFPHVDACVPRRRHLCRMEGLCLCVSCSNKLPYGGYGSLVGLVKILVSPTFVWLSFFLENAAVAVL